MKIMKNPIKFIQDVKQEAFKVTWPTWKETLQGSLMVFAMAVVMSLFFLLLDEICMMFVDLCQFAKSNLVRLPHVDHLPAQWKHTVLVSPNHRQSCDLDTQFII